MATVVNLVDESEATSLPHPQEESSPLGRGEEEFERRFSLRLKRKETASSVKTNPSKEVKPKNVKVKKAEVRGECSDSVKEKRENIEVRGDCSDLVKAEGENIEDRGGGGGSGLVNVQEKSAHALVKETLRIFNTHYLHFVQEEEKRCKKEADTMRNAQTSNYKGKRVDVEKVKRSSKRPDLKAITKMIETNTILNHSKIIGSLDGVDVGHQFFSRAEMVVIGLHNHWLNGINYMGQSYKKGENYKNYTFPIALSIVMSGQYEDDVDNSEEVVYTGQGGNDLLGNKSQIQDQKLDRGNLALKNSMEHDVPIRVIRGQVSNNSYVGRVYTYDGLYKVVKYWAEKGVSGFTVFKYRLRRLEGQPDLTTNQVNFVRAKMPRSLSELRGLVSEDISGGQENIPIPATNSVDDPPFPPSGYVYNKSIKVRTNVKVPPPGSGCNCHGVCNDPEECACARLNGSDFPYVRRDGGRLVEAKAVVFECGPNCGCGPGCVNRTSQQGLRYRLEVFRTPKKGWAVRSWDHIPAGAPICEYAGLLMKSDEIDKVAHDTFVFEIDCIQTMKGIDGRESRLGGASLLADNVDLDSTAEYCIDAGPVGNVGRFVNHSCQPNLFVQCVLSSHRDIKLARVFLFAADNIPPLQELTYDYGYVLDSVVGPDGQIKKMPCYCGAPDCKKRLY